MKVIIAGGGIGGLTAALSLHAAGIDTVVYESAAQVLPLGVGINILPNGARELIDLGLEEDMDEFAIRTSAMNYYTREGNLVISQPCGLHAGYSWPQWSLHRGELQMMLLRKFRERAGADKVITGAMLNNFEQRPTGKVVARFTNTQTQASFTDECDVLVGADGLHSVTRARLYPHEGKPVYSGMVVYRATVETPQFLDGMTMAIIGDKRLRLVIYPVSSRLLHQGRARSLNNWIGVLLVAEDEAPSEDWQNLSQQEKLRPRYASWKFDWIDVSAILQATTEILEFPVYDRDPLQQWSFGRVTLLGDAAHPLIPVSSNGAGQAILDARALAFALASYDDPARGLEMYEADRLEQAARLVRASRANGPDKVLEVARQRCPEGAGNIHDFVSLNELQGIIDDFKKQAGFDADTLNSRPSYNAVKGAGDALT